MPPADATRATTSTGGPRVGLSTVRPVIVEQQPPDHERVTLRFLDQAIVSLGPPVRSGAPEPAADSARQVGALVQRAKRGSERGFNCLVLPGQKRVGAVGVADPAAEAQPFGARRFGQDAAAGRTGEGRLIADAVASLECLVIH